MEMPTGNTAAGPATLHPDSRDQYVPGNLILYRTSLALYRNLKNQGVFNEEEYCHIRTMDHLTKRDEPNNGELPKYHITDAHEAIIPLRSFNAVQEEIKRRAEKHTHPGVKHKEYSFSGRITCAGCGKHYRRKVKETGPVWICTTYNTHGKAACPSKAIPESILEAIADEIGGIGKITALQACDDNTLVLTLTSGEQIVKRWQDRSRRQSWTPEMKEKARQKDLERRSHHAST